MNNFYCSFVSIHYIICECGDTFPTEESLQVHLENEHKNGDVETSEYQCNTCGKIFSTEKSCLIHQQVHMRKVKRPESRDTSQPKKRYYLSKNIVCEVCGKRYASNAALRYHQRVHTGERPYHCSMCPKTFTMPLFLQIHVRTHTGERPYECPLCPKAFSNKAALLRHNRVHTGIKPYECPQCGKFFTQSNSMKLHVKTVHLKMPAPYKSKSRRAKQAMRSAHQSDLIRMPDAGSEMSVRVPADNAAYRAVTVKREASDCEGEEADDDGRVYQEEVYQQDEDLYEEIKVEISDMPTVVYEDDVEESNVVYEEVYDM